mgnify:CR=1 FL=1
MRYIVDITEDSGIGGIVALIVIVAIIIGSCGSSKHSNSETRTEKSTYTDGSNSGSDDYNDTYYDYDDNAYIDDGTASNYSTGDGVCNEQVEQLPKPLINCYRVMRSHSMGIYEGNISDAFGTMHNNCIAVSCASKDVYSVTYNLDRRYTSLACQFVHGDGIYEASCQISIYLDDSLIHTSPNISVTTEPIYESIDVTGVKLVKIEVVSPDVIGTKVGQVIIDAAVS